jgi:hypothetical protein
LDTGGHETCSRLDASLYSIIIQLILQANHCREGERGMYLLAVSIPPPYSLQYIADYEGWLVLRFIFEIQETEYREEKGKDWKGLFIPIVGILHQPKQSRRHEAMGWSLLQR